MTTFWVLLPLVAALLSAPVSALAVRLRPALAAPAGAVLAAIAFVATLRGWWTGGGTIDWAWAPAWDLHFALDLDGLAVLYSLLATGIGFLVLV